MFADQHSLAAGSAICHGMDLLFLSEPFYATNPSISDCTQGRSQKCYVSLVRPQPLLHGPLTRSRTAANKVTCRVIVHLSPAKSASATSVRPTHVLSHNRVP